MAQNPWELPDGLDESTKDAVKSIFEAFKNARKMIPKEALEALRFGNIDGFMSLIDWNAIGQGFNPTQEILGDVAKKAAIEVFKKGNIGTRLAFDIIDERAVNFAQWQGAKLVTNITEEMRANIRDVITRSTSGLMTVQEAADTIYRFIPLTVRDAKAVERYQERQYNRFLKKGLTDATAKKRASKMADAYADKLTLSRATTIARTETAFAATEGKYLGWESGVQTGLIDNSSLKEWVAEPDACEICHDMDGKTVKWDGAFEFGGLMPPAHPNCRCTAAILPPDYADSPYTRMAFGKSVAGQFEIELQKHLAGKHDQSTHGHHGVAYTLPSKREAPDLSIYSEVSSVKPYVGLSPKAQAIAAQIGGTYGQQLEVLDKDTHGLDGYFDISHADWTSSNGQTYKLTLKRELKMVQDDATGIISRSKNWDGVYPSISVELSSPDGKSESYLQCLLGWAGKLDDANFHYVISDVFSDVKGAGTAMLEFARREADYPIFHNSDLTSQGRKFARTTKSVEIEKHLSGKHDQSTHAGGHTHSHLPTNSGLSQQDKISALNIYVSWGHSVINEKLRSGSTLDNELSNTTKTLEAFIKEQPVTEKRMTLYRGVSDMDELEDVRTGDIFTDKGFMSTSSSYDVAKTHGDVILKISVPAGSQMLDVTATGVNIGTRYANEKEFLFAPNTQLRAKSSSREDYSDPYAERVVEYELIPDGTVAKHLLGQHDQTTHGHGHSTARPYELQPDKTTYEARNFTGIDGQKTVALQIASFGLGAKLYPNQLRGFADNFLQDIAKDPKYPKMSPELQKWYDNKRWGDPDHPDYAAYKEKESQFVVDKLREMKLEDGTTIGHVMDDMADTALSQLKNIALNDPVTLTMPLARFKKMMDDGRYKTAYEAPITGKGASRQKYLDARYDIESKLGVPSNTPDSDRPVYGIFGTGGLSYGDVRIEMKDDVKHRATVSIGDSADGHVTSVFWASDLASGKSTRDDFWDAYAQKVSVFAFNENVSTWFDYDTSKSDSKIKGYKGFKDVANDLATYGYIETQIHGGVKLSDLSKVYLPPSFKIPPATQKLLDDNGIAVEREEIERTNVG